MRQTLLLGLSVLGVSLGLNGAALAAGKTSTATKAPAALAPAKAALSEGKDYYDKDNGPAAIAAFSKAITLNPKLADAYYCRGLAYRHVLDEDAKGLPDLKKAVQLEPKNPDFMLELGKALQYLDRPAEALTVLTNALAVQKTAAEEKDKAGTAYAAQRTHRPDYAAFVSRSYKLEAQKQRAEYYYYRAWCHKDLHNIDDAIRDFSEAIILDAKAAPENSDWFLERGNVLVNAGKTDLALNDYNHVKHCSLRGRGLADRAELAWHLGFHEEALADLQKYANDKDVSMYTLGTLAGDFGLHREAISSLEKAISQKPDFACAYNNLGSTLVELGEYERALDWYQKATQRKPEHAEHVAGMADVEWKLGRTDSAMRHADRAIEIANRGLQNNAHDEGSLSGRAIANRIKGNYAQALADARELMKVQPNSYETLGEIYLVSGDKQNALDAFTKAMAYSKSNELKYNVGALLKDLGKVAEGEAQIEAALATGYKPPTKQQPSVAK